MPTYESKFFGLRMQIPDGWSYATRTDDGLQAFADESARWTPESAKAACFDTTLVLLRATLAGPGSTALIDAQITLFAYTATDEQMLTSELATRLKKWSINGISAIYAPETRGSDKRDEPVHFRHVRWKVGTNLWLYATLQASGRARFDYVISIFETLAPFASKNREKRNPLYCREPWTTPPSVFRMIQLLPESGSLFDVVRETELTDAEYRRNAEILNYETNHSVKGWTTTSFRRKSRVKRWDCHRCDDFGRAPYLYSVRAVELFRSHMRRGDYAFLPVMVDGKPYFVIHAVKAIPCLNVRKSLIKRFSHGGIMYVQRYYFKARSVRDPSLFGIPEDPYDILVTASIPKLAAAAGLKGIDFIPINGHGREFTCPG